MRSVTMGRNELIGSMIVLIALILLSFGINNSYYRLACISIIELLFCVFVVRIFGGHRLVSIPIFFLFFTWFFHCGQIILKGFGIEGYIPLDFTRFAETANQINAFRFYFFGMGLLSIGMIHEHGKEVNNNKFVMNPRKSSYYLIAIGIIPRLYIDALRIIGGITDGYRGVYSLYIPQFVSSLAFFFDVGVVIKLIHEKSQITKNRLFWLILLYKSAAMLTGSRQEKVAFLIIWLYIYFFSFRGLSLKRVVAILSISLVGITLLDAIGDTRGIGTFSISNIINNVMSHDTGSRNIISNSLGEFGSAFCSLELPFQQIPSVSGYGYGKSYIAGILSAIPLLVSRIPFLATETTFVTKFVGSTFFGGSFLGEAYYNFGWLGLIICFITGSVASSCQKYLFEKDTYEDPTIRSVMSVVVAMSLMLFIRGYFTDMAQKIIWIYVALRFINRNQTINV